ncbi:MAG: energy-coupling factor transporter ATPase [Oscillospiraceae bacterium]|nr:energy-coupling factor transporter ATPase [Oscillospiraceae bacterium]
MLKNSFIEANNISFSYPSYDGVIPPLVLDGVSISIKEGEFMAVLGHNGSGKSTLAKHFNAILVPTEGEVSVNGIRTADEEKLFEIRQEVGMVFQNPDNQIVATIIEEDVAFALENLGVPPKEIRERVDDALKKVDMYDYRLHAPNQLSGGQKQRIAIAGIVAMRPKCVVLDEPTAMLDPKGRREVMSTIKQLNKELGITVVIITHYMDEAAMCDRVAIVDDGKVIMDSTPREVFANVDAIKERGLDVPQVTELCHELKKEGFDLPDCVLSEEECVAALESLLKGGAQNG